MPTRRNGPVSSNVSHHICNAVATRNSALTPGLRKLMIASSANTKLKASAPRLRTLPAGRSSKARSWLALRASVLRRAVRPSGTAQERRDEVNTRAASQGNRGAPRTHSSVCNTPSAQFEFMENECFTSLANMPGNTCPLLKTSEVTRTLHSAPPRKWLALCWPNTCPLRKTNEITRTLHFAPSRK